MVKHNVKTLAFHNIQRLYVVVGAVQVEPCWPLGVRRVRGVVRADIALIGPRVAFP
mgnify:CR=1 FL=1